MMQMIFNVSQKRRVETHVARDGDAFQARKVERREIETLLAAELSALPPLAV